MSNLRTAWRELEKNREFYEKFGNNNHIKQRPRPPINKEENSFKSCLNKEFVVPKYDIRRVFHEKSYNSFGITHKDLTKIKARHQEARQSR